MISYVLSGAAHSVGGVVEGQGFKIVKVCTKLPFDFPSGFHSASAQGEYGEYHARNYNPHQR